jgi:hypothetical protein
MGPREPIMKALTEHHGPLVHHARYGAAIPTTDDRITLKVTGLGAVVLFAAAITQAGDRRGLLLDTAHYNAAEAELAQMPTG